MTKLEKCIIVDNDVISIDLNKMKDGEFYPVTYLGQKYEFRKKGHLLEQYEVVDN